MARGSTAPRRTAPPPVEALSSFQMSWPEELESALIEIMRSYIKSGKLADNVFKKTDHTAIALELQPTCSSLDLGPDTNIILGKQIIGLRSNRIRSNFQVVRIRRSNRTYIYIKFDLDSTNIRQTSNLIEL
jgi:hypothetical protein